MVLELGLAFAGGVPARGRLELDLRRVRKEGRRVWEETEWTGEDGVPGRPFEVAGRLSVVVKEVFPAPEDFRRRISSS